MKKNILEYNTFIHYGCSFTYGEDSGGDGIHDDNLSYPAHLSRIIGNKYINKGSRGFSASAIYARLCMDLCYSDMKYNDNSDEVYIINLPSMYRFLMIEFLQEINTHEDLYLSENQFFIPNNRQIYYDNKKYMFLNFLSRKNSTSNIDMKKIFLQDDIYFLLEMSKNIYAIHSLLREFNKPHIFIDMQLDYNKTFKKFNNKFDDLIINKDGSLYSNISQTHVSMSKHFYSSGYEEIAKTVYNLIKDYEC